MMYQRTCERCGRPVQLEEVADENLRRWEKFPEDFKNELLQKHDEEIYKYFEFQNFMKKSRRLCMFLGALILVICSFNAIPYYPNIVATLIDVGLGALCGYILHKYRGGFIRGCILSASCLVISISLKAFIFGAVMIGDPSAPPRFAGYAIVLVTSGILSGIAIQNMIENKLGVG